MAVVGTKPALPSSISLGGMQTSLRRTGTIHPVDMCHTRNEGRRQAGEFVMVFINQPNQVSGEGLRTGTHNCRSRTAYPL